MKPIRNKIYTTKEVYELDLLDSPFLMIYYGDQWHPIQTSCLSVEETIEALPFCDWEYKYTTEEWCPIFFSTNSEEVFKKHLEIREEDDENYLYIKEKRA